MDIKQEVLKGFDCNGPQGETEELAPVASLTPKQHDSAIQDGIAWFIVETVYE